MKIQPIDYSIEESIPSECVKPVPKSLLRRLFERPFPNVLRISTIEKSSNLEEPQPLLTKGGSSELDPSSVCLAKMVQNFIEESSAKQSAVVRCGRHRCSCFCGSCSNSSLDELNLYGSVGDSNLTSTVDSCDILKRLVACASVREKLLLADTTRIVEENKLCKRKDGISRKVVTDGLLALGYDASICTSRWEKSPSFPAGEYEYVDVLFEGDRLLIDIDFRLEFEIVRSTKSYKAMLQILPVIFVGTPDRLQRIITILSEGAKQSLKKKGMHLPPWRRAEYVKAKWLSPHSRATATLSDGKGRVVPEKNKSIIRRSESDLSCEEKSAVDETEMAETFFELSGSGSSGEEQMDVVKEGKLTVPEIKLKKRQFRVKFKTKPYEV